MTGIDSRPARPQGRRESFADVVPEVLRALASEFVVEWQVADRAALAPVVPAWEK